MWPQARRLCPETISFPYLFQGCHSRLRSSSVDQQKFNSFRRKTACFLASGSGSRRPRKMRASDRRERAAGPISRVRTCEKCEFEGGRTKKMKQNGALSTS